MSSVNKVILVGYLGRDPETRTFPSGDQVCNASIATTDKWKDKQTGEMKEATEWHRLNFNGRLAEIAAEYLRKGSLIYVEGQIRTRKYQKDGVDHYATDIRVDQMKMLGSPPENRGDRGGRQDDGGHDDRGGRDSRDNRGGGGREDQRRDDRGGDSRDNRDSGRSNDRGGYQQQRERDEGYGRGGGGGHDTRRGDPAPTGRGPAPAPAARQQAQAPAQQSRGGSGFDDMDSDIPF